MTFLPLFLLSLGGFDFLHASGAAGAVFSPVGFGDKHAAADRERNYLRTGAGVTIVKGNTVAVLTVTALPPYYGVGMLSGLRAIVN